MVCWVGCGGAGHHGSIFMLGAGHETPPDAGREVTERDDCEGLAGPVSIPETGN